MIRFLQTAAGLALFVAVIVAALVLAVALEDANAQNLVRGRS